MEMSRGGEQRPLRGRVGVVNDRNLCEEEEPEEESEDPPSPAEDHSTTLIIR